MIELGNNFREFADLESMVQAAGGYVEASDDLRPRVLESARTHCREQRARRRIQKAAVFVLLLAGFTTSATGVLDTPRPGSELALGAADSSSIHSRARAYAARRGDIGWGMVEAFTELRRRQSAAFRL
jgi:hypothetical protein